jgi:hypothetical protein
MGWPQLIVLVLLLADLATGWILDGDEIEKSFLVTFGHTALIFGLLVWGGFFGGAQ